MPLSTTVSLRGVVAGLEEFQHQHFIYGGHHGHAVIPLDQGPMILLGPVRMIKTTCLESFIDSAIAL